MVQRLLQVRAHLILCFRAEEKIEMKRNVEGKMEITKKQTATGLDGWVPISEKNLPYELTASFLLLATAPGVPLPIKLQEQHKELFPRGEAITEQSGKRLAEWANSGAAPQAISPLFSSAAVAAPSNGKSRTDTLQEACTKAKLNYKEILTRAEVKHADEMSDEDFTNALATCKKRAAKLATI